MSFEPLQPGEPVGVVALSGPVRAERLEAGLEVLRRAGHPPLVAPNVARCCSGYLAGTDADRAEGLEWVLDRGVTTLVAARGGYGVSRALDLLPWRRLAAERVTFVGFSDLTAVLNPLAGLGGCVQVHGPMVAAGLAREANASRLLNLLHGDLVGRELFALRESAVVRPGRASGRSVGGNLAVLTSLIGTPYEPCWDDSIVFLEDVNEPLYRLDRMLTHLRVSGRLRQVKALIGGSLRGCRPAEGREQRWRELLVEAAPGDAPVVAGLPFGHGSSNRAFPIGARVDVDTEARTLVWSG